jgi:hypothetical protein
MMKMQFYSNPRKKSTAPTIQPITIPIQAQRQNTSDTNYPFSSLIERLRYVGPCSSCGGK